MTSTAASTATVDRLFHPGKSQWRQRVIDNYGDQEWCVTWNLEKGPMKMTDLNAMLFQTLYTSTKREGVCPARTGRQERVRARSPGGRGG